MSGDCEMEEVSTVVLCSERCHLGEGPTYDAATDTAWWFDIVERRLFEARLDTGQTTIHSLDVMGSALGRIDAHRQRDLREVAEEVEMPVDHRKLERVGKPHACRFAHFGAPAVLQGCEHDHADRRHDDSRGQDTGLEMKLHLGPARA